MAAVIGLSFDDISALTAGLQDVYVANYNSPTQIVVSGTQAGLNAFETACKDKGARRFIRLKVSGPFHSPLLKQAKDEFQSALESVPFSDPVIPLYSNVTGKRITAGSEAKRLCAEQIVSTVRWVDEENGILADAYERCLEAGPGSVLCGLWKAVSRETPCLPAGSMDDIDKIL